MACSIYSIMNRQRFLILATIVLLVGNIGYRVWANWGLITVNATEASLASVIHSIEKQASVKIRTNLDPETKITMHVKKVPLAYALEVLANVAEARWQLGFFLAPSKAPIENALDTLSASSKIEGWKNWFVDLPVGPLDDRDLTASDPRIDRWETKPASEGTLHAYLEQASRSVSARFQAPEDWNPAVSSAPKPGKIVNVIPSLAKAAGGQFEQVFLLMGRPRIAANADTSQDNERGPRGGRLDGLFGPDAEKRAEAIGARMQAEIDKLPAGDREKAQARFDEGRKFFESLRGLSDEERRAKFQELMQDPGRQEKMAEGMARRDALKTPQQRNERYRGYIARKQAAE
jgi:hypothetical protein